MKAVALQYVARNVADLARAEKFYTSALGFRVTGAGQDAELAALLRLRALHFLRLEAGGRAIALCQCEPAGAPYLRLPATHVNFQHIALLTPDIAAAYARALGAGAEPISAGPVRLPPSSGGVTAVKFRDPDGHPLEFIQREATGYDHSAISVADVAASIAFYRGIGLEVTARQVNRGPEQAALDGIAGAELDVIALTPPQASPHVELLGYRNPKPIAQRWAFNDLCADRLCFLADSPGLALSRDPDGHVIVLDGRGLEQHQPDRNRFG